MKSNLFVLTTVILASLGTSLTLRAAPAGIGPSFRGPIGLQLYSLRDQFAKDVPGTLDLVKKLGFTDVELAGTYNLSPEQFKAQLDAHGLRAVSGHFPYERFRDDLDGIIREATLFGIRYIGCAWIPHSDPFDERTCREAIAVFNRAGEKLAARGLTFFYHTHGYEFQAYEKGTLFDLIMAETNPKYVSFQMDIFWVAHAEQDPVKLLEKYGHRWQLMHLKGMKDSTPTGLLNGHSDVSNDVPLGQGKIAFPPLLRAAAAAGVKWYFIEDESPSVEKQLPQSLEYLEHVRF